MYVATQLISSVTSYLLQIFNNNNNYYNIIIWYIYLKVTIHCYTKEILLMIFRSMRLLYLLYRVIILYDQYYRSLPVDSVIVLAHRTQSTAHMHGGIAVVSDKRY